MVLSFLSSLFLIPTPKGDSVRLPVTMLGMDGAGKTSIIRALTTQVCMG